MTLNYRPPRIHVLASQQERSATWQVDIYFYLSEEALYPDSDPRMPDEVPETYI